MLSLLTPILLLATGTFAFSLSELIITTNTSLHNSISQQNPAVIPPFPILQVALEHILSQIGRNATEAENATIAGGSSGTPRSSTRRDVSKSLSLNERDAPAQCGPNSPCADGSCCNSVLCLALRCVVWRVY
jgi:hypothetical protein